MSYKVQFLGLVCFYREGNTRLALLPDGRTPGNGIDPHYATIVVDPDLIEGTTGWDDVDMDEEGVFPLSPCRISIEGSDAPGTLDVSGHNGLPQLSQINPDFKIDPDRAQTIARMRITQGRLTAYRMPDAEAAVSELDVPHEGSVTITVKAEKGGSPDRTIRVKNGAEIVISNMARDVYKKGEHRDGHFKIYEKLAAQPAPLTEPTTIAANLSVLKSNNPLLRSRKPVGLYVSCSNTGCCGG